MLLLSRHVLAIFLLYRHDPWLSTLTRSKHKHSIGCAPVSRLEHIVCLALAYCCHQSLAIITDLPLPLTDWTLTTDHQSLTCHWSPRSAFVCTLHTAEHGSHADTTQTRLHGQIRRMAIIRVFAVFIFCFILLFTFLFNHISSHTTPRIRIGFAAQAISVSDGRAETTLITGHCPIRDVFFLVRLNSQYSLLFILLSINSTNSTIITDALSPSHHQPQSPPHASRVHSYSSYSNY